MFDLKIKEWIKMFENIIGQKKIKTFFTNAIKNNKLSQAYLFCGLEGTGKDAVAVRDPKEIKRHLYTTAQKIRRDKIADRGESARNAPRPVAIPLPPLNFRKIG